MRAIREFRLPTTKSDHAKPWKSESLITADQSFNVNYHIHSGDKNLVTKYSLVFAG